MKNIQGYLDAPSGFPGFESYPLTLLDKVCRDELSLEKFVKITSENPAKLFNLKNKGFVKEGYDADLIIVDKIPEYPIKSKKFKTKAKFSSFSKR
jgi:dihydroorotase